MSTNVDYRGPARFHRLTPNKRFEPMPSTVIMAVCSLFNKMLLSTDLIPVHFLYRRRTVMEGCNRTCLEWIRAVRHIYGIIRHTQGLYWQGHERYLCMVTCGLLTNHRHGNHVLMYESYIMSYYVRAFNQSDDRNI